MGRLFHVFDHPKNAESHFHRQCESRGFSEICLHSFVLPGLGKYCGAIVTGKELNVKDEHHKVQRSIDVASA